MCERVMALQQPSFLTSSYAASDISAASSPFDVVAPGGEASAPKQTRLSLVDGGPASVASVVVAPVSSAPVWSQA